MKACLFAAAFGAAPYGQTAGLNILRVRLPPDEAEFGLNLPTTRALAAYYSHVKIIATPWSPLHCFSPPRILRIRTGKPILHQSVPPSPATR
ncbi:hypothetical protein DIPPA_30762 [Diplonema papillatum]|nr:hypothetical protein DIPPA_30762 [Diplonema papillatum]